MTGSLRKLFSPVSYPKYLPKSSFKVFPSLLIEFCLPASAISSSRSFERIFVKSGAKDFASHQINPLMLIFPTRDASIPFLITQGQSVVTKPIPTRTMGMSTFLVIVVNGNFFDFIDNQLPTAPSANRPTQNVKI